MRVLLPMFLIACSGGGEPAPTKTDSGPTNSDTALPTGDDDDDDVTEPTDTTEPGWLDGSLCYARNVFEVNCVTGCHSAVVPAGNLDLETDPYSATVGRLSSIEGVQLVVPGQPENSLLYRMMTGEVSPEEGGVMPPAGVLPEFLIDPVRVWIEQGAPNDCNPDVVVEQTTTTATDDAPYHPPGWTAPTAHGLAANLQTDGDCRVCHGANLDGGVANVSCDSCHSAGWRSDCTFCHGGGDNQTGAPPQDIDNETINISFLGHSAHVDGDDHKAYECVQCHRQPTDLMTPGHVFGDVTPGYGEMYYVFGLSPVATYQAGTCSNTYCHGDGYNALGTAYSADGPRACYDCHADANQGDLDDMSGRHELHVSSGLPCADCHGNVVDANQVVINPEQHVDGDTDYDLGGVVYDAAGTCTGVCHNYNHNARPW